MIRWDSGEDHWSILPPFVERNQEKMGRHSIITKADVLKIVRLLRWVTRAVLVLFFAGRARRIKALEKLLPILEREGFLAFDWHRGEKVYSIARKDRVGPVSMGHEIACALILVLFWRCRMEEGEIIPERAFRGFGIVPENGLRFSEERNTMLIFEFETPQDFVRKMKSKITRYLKYLPAMEAKFKRNITVLFVIDVERSKVKDFVNRISQLASMTNFADWDDTGEREDGSDGSLRSPLYQGDTFPLNPFFFTDYQTLKSAPIGEALRAKIYFWHDGDEWSLSDND